MDLIQYHWLHILGLMSVFLGLGFSVGAKAIEAGNGSPRKLRIPASILHGVGMLVLLVSGFGSLAKLGMVGGMAEFPTWVWIKLLVWLALGMMVTVVKRTQLNVTALSALFLILGSLAAFAAFWKP